MRALIVTNMWPSPASPALGVFVRDQVEALRAVGGPDLDLEVAAFGPGGYARAVPDLRRRAPADVVHAHFGLTAWPALAARGRVRLVTLHGTDVRHPRSGPITRAALPFQATRAKPRRPLHRRAEGTVAARKYGSGGPSPRPPARRWRRGRRALEASAEGAAVRSCADDFRSDRDRLGGPSRNLKTLRARTNFAPYTNGMRSDVRSPAGLLAR